MQTMPNEEREKNKNAIENWICDWPNGRTEREGVRRRLESAPHVKRHQRPNVDFGAIKDAYMQARNKFLLVGALEHCLELEVD